ncbi:hypothetical protein EUGRSUZ_J00831 [Eucalyptus grandis]|uniref:Uncharacterized protein n=2 Tax=Eucalyptus grandis TaxID=71139 RepID=A0ACC3J5X8_EUCGR|nr:hypothetical protein EUGRSUZ_J00831 [Eucalyptus grandis]
MPPNNESDRRERWRKWRPWTCSPIYVCIEEVPIFICVDRSRGVSEFSLDFLNDRAKVRASCNGLLCCSASMGV